MRSGMTACRAPCRRSLPTMRMVGVPAPSMRGAHAHEQLGEVADLGLAGGVVDHRLALRQAGGHQDVLGAGDADRLEADLGAAQPLRPRLDVAVLHLDLGAHPLQRGEVQVDRARADGAAARQRHARAALAGDQRAEHEHGGAHRLDEVVGRLDGAQGARPHLDGAADAELDLGAERLEHAAHGADVAHLGDVREHHGLVGQQGGAQVRQGGVLGAGDADRAFEGPAADDADAVHPASLAAVSGASRPRRSAESTAGR